MSNLACMVVRARWLVLVVVLLGATGPPARAHAPGTLLYDFADPAITESSGVVVGSLSDGQIFTHNDSGGGSVFFAVDADGNTISRYSLTFGPRRAIDWEDIAAGPGPGGVPSLFLADIGDNGRNRPLVTIYVVAEPTPVFGQPFVDVAPIATHHLVYEDGPHDAEAFVVDPATGAMAIITKETSGAAGVYLASPVLDDLAGVGDVSTLHRVATLDIGAIASPYDPSHYDELSRLLVTGADISPDGTRLVVRTYIEAFEWQLGPSGIAGGVVGDPHRIDLPATQQGEAIGYAWDGRSVVVTSEGLHAPVHLLAAES